MTTTLGPPQKRSVLTIKHLFIDTIQDMPEDIKRRIIRRITAEWMYGQCQSGKDT